jgi:hypothetical protein
MFSDVRKGWKCPDCGAVWAPWYPGPCTHPENKFKNVPWVPDNPPVKYTGQAHPDTFVTITYRKED